MAHNTREGIEERIEQELHNYGAWLLNNPKAEPLERRAEKNRRAKTLIEEVFHQELQKAREEILAINEENLKDLVGGVYSDSPAIDKILRAYNRIKYALTDQSDGKWVKVKSNK